MAASRYRIDAPAIAAAALRRATPPNSPPGLALVLPTSPVGLRRAVQTLTDYASSELHSTPGVERCYDGNGYHAQAPNPSAEAWLWAIEAWDEKPRAIGVCVMLEHAPSTWALTWAWMHPFERRRGHLTKAWPYLQSRYGAFTVDQPSAAMQAFLAGR
ncbi:hypothetical protein C8N24_0323 [Solirubrobacter pauli]|uniref:Acetyltransferase (GNAT) family protein n=1 Tax=Solirubrobacter pauli TaxID=166793 RepID=A0A660L673_9ACTN|nr:hypothetical protein [Solirubrobacter pauli]RKQ90518.1 hypothetical protein C8N24_0323 [Solirubrobacter pauli]